MSVVIETTIGDITVDLYLKDRPNTCLNFLKLCKIKYYNLSLFHKIEKNFIAQSGDPTGTGRGGESVFCQLYGDQAKYFESEVKPRLKHEKLGTISMVNNGNNMNGSQFFLTLGENLTYLDEVHTVFGEVVEGLNTLLKLNEAICDGNNRPYQDIRITHTVILHDSYEDPKGLQVPDASPEPTREQLESGYIAADEEIDDTKGKTSEEIDERIKESEAKARATILEMVGDIPDADVKPPENVLFVCKLNPVTTSEDLEIIFSRFGTIISCEVIKDRKTGESLQYAFIEFEKEEDCENAYFKMDNVLIDDRRIHVDFSQSVSKMGWDKDNKFSNVRWSKQNVVLKEKSKGTDGYDLIFDMNDDAQAGSDNKNNKKCRSKTPDYKRSNSVKFQKYEDRNRYRLKSPDLKKKQQYVDKREHSLSLDRQSSSYKQHSDRNRSRSPNLKKSKRHENVRGDPSSSDRQSFSRNHNEKDKSYKQKNRSSYPENKNKEYDHKINKRSSPKRSYRNSEESRKSSSHDESSRNRHRHDTVSPNRDRQKSNDRQRRQSPSYERSAKTKDFNSSDHLKGDRRDKKCKSSHKESKRSKDLHSPQNAKCTSSQKLSSNKKKKPKKRSRSSSVSSSSSSSASPVAKKQSKKYSTSSESASSSSVEKISKNKYKHKAISPTDSYDQRKKHIKKKYA